MVLFVILYYMWQHNTHTVCIVLVYSSVAAQKWKMEGLEKPL